MDDGADGYGQTAFAIRPPLERLSKPHERLAKVGDGEAARHRQVAGSIESMLPKETAKPKGGGLG